MIISLKVIQL
nr:unnamed protein product [Callosobruchus chinensis]